MRGRKHPLDIYQRGSPFGAFPRESWGESSDRRPDHGAGKTFQTSSSTDHWAALDQPSRALAADGISHRSRARRSAAWVRARVWDRLQRIPLRRLAWAGGALVLGVAALYAVRFLPGRGIPAPGGTGPLRNEWRDPREAPVDAGHADSAVETSKVWMIQLEGELLVGIKDLDEELRRWDERREQLQLELDEKTRELGIELTVHAIHSDDQRRDVRWIVGNPRAPWVDPDDEELRLVLNWLKDNGHELAFLLHMPAL